MSTHILINTIWGEWTLPRTEVAFAVIRERCVEYPQSQQGVELPFGIPPLFSFCLRLGLHFPITGCSPFWFRLEPSLSCISSPH